MKHFLLTLLIYPLFLNSLIITTEDVTPYLNLADGQTLVILDVADTLIGFKDAVLQKDYDEWKNNTYNQLLPDATFEQTANYIKIVEENPENWVLINPEWPNLISNLKEKGVTVIGLTKTLVYPPLQKSLENTLATFGITFSHELIATSLPLKGEVVDELVNRLKPSTVIFIDDRLEQVESVDQALNDLSIDHTSIYFERNTPLVSLNLAMAQKQIETLVQDKIWLSDDSLENRPEI